MWIGIIYKLTLILRALTRNRKKTKLKWDKGGKNKKKLRRHIRNRKKHKQHPIQGRKDNKFTYIVLNITEIH